MGKYTKYLIYFPNGTNICAICQHVFNRQKDSCTTIYNYHFKKHHVNVWHEINGREPEPDNYQPVEKKPRELIQVVEPVWNPHDVQADTPDYAKNTEIYRSIMQLIAGAGLPISFVDNPVWRNFCSVALPKLEYKNENEFKKYELPTLYEEYKMKIVGELEEASSISLSFDRWIDPSNDYQYVGIIARLKMQSGVLIRVIGVVEIKPKNDTGEYLYEKLEELVKEYKIKRKIDFIVKDGSLNVECAARLFGKPSFNCIARKLEFAVKSGAEKSFQSTLDKLLKFRSIFNKSVKAEREYRNIELSMSYFKNYVRHRWNECHDLFKGILMVQQEVDSLTTTTYEDWPKFTREDWTTAQDVLDVLKPIEDATRFVEYGRIGMTSSAIIPLCKVLIREFENINKLRDFCTVFTKILVEELEVYNENEFLQMGMLLDVRFKGDFAEEKWKEHLIDKLMKSAAEGKLQEETQPNDSVRRLRDNPFHRFMREKRSETPQGTKRTQHEIIRAEVQIWFNEASDSEANPADYWERSTSREKFPNLYRLQQEYLHTPAAAPETVGDLPLNRSATSTNRGLMNAEDFSKFLFLQENIRITGLGLEFHPIYFTDNF
ncbi:hypothetical protein GCK72_025382 [Caenorhabditis remanei]|uniref:HAT C-terminal dimerisation domain-containing protein n=1 Tax=Caenorhabditis remanei TaxID=31234 RepID=A0A6A5G2K2_CAERE|nr:hypothetical protein GCK72_025382 [Caenorhabditis remanei]KAF1748915.1 hypothetical protein GCK72_025382 [Caenorhabditis remanei]